MLPRVKCLLVDDREENLLVLEALLAQENVELLKAHSGPEALELLLLHDIALAFLDVQMPGMDGFELAELMRGSERSRHVPIIFITAGPRDQLRMFQGYEAGAVDFIYKPIDVRILKNKADVFFQLYRQKVQLAQELQERTETLQLNEMFTAVLGHDLRNPLSAMVLSAQLLQIQSKDDGVRDVAARMLSSGKRMSRMIDDLLDMTRARLAGGILLKRAPTNLGALVDRVVLEYRPAYPDHPIEILREGDLTGEWDGDRLAQVVANLVGNALQYGVSGAPVHIHVDGAQADALALSVQNAGLIPADMLPHVFDPFRRGQRQQGHNDGLGLGLYIVQQIVQAHQGRIEVKSGDSGSTTFRMEVPRRPPGTQDIGTQRAAQ